MTNRRRAKQMSSRDRRRIIRRTAKLLGQKQVDLEELADDTLGMLAGKLGVTKHYLESDLIPRYRHTLRRIVDEMRQATDG